MLIESFGHRQVLRLLQPIDRYSRRCVSRANGIRTRSLRKFSYSRMLDMGGAPSAGSDQTVLRTVNASKNSKLQVVAFDFQTLININDSKKNESDDVPIDWTTADLSTNQAVQENRESLSSTNTDVDRVTQLAALLNVDLGSLQNGMESENANVTPTASKQQSAGNLKDHNPSDHDVRAKYASKIQGGMAGIELAKSKVEKAATSGDAAGHLAARKFAIMDGATNSSNDNNTNTTTRWLPSLAATELLTLLTHRSIRIVLLPTLDTKTTSTEDENEPRMEDFKSQLRNVVIDNIIPKIDDNQSDGGIEDALTTGIINKLGVDPNKILMVSKRDSYLRVARDMGMNICRLRPKNARRGSITAHYTVQTVGQVQDVVNEVNGISFNTVLNR